MNKFARLRDDWLNTEVNPGDYVHIIGKVLPRS